MENDKNPSENPSEFYEKLKAILEDLESRIVKMNPSEKDIPKLKEDIMVIKSFLHVITHMENNKES
jgi:hypothetical protein